MLAFKKSQQMVFDFVIVFVLFIEISKVSNKRETQCSSLSSNLKIIFTHTIVV